jgi:hypothetical protein
LLGGGPDGRKQDPESNQGKPGYSGAGKDVPAGAGTPLMLTELRQDIEESDESHCVDAVGILL